MIDESMRYGNAGDGACVAGGPASGRSLSAGGTLAQQTVFEGDGDELAYLHGDLIRSTVAITDADGQSGVYSGPPITVAYTAFGEIVHNDGSDNITIGAAPPAGFLRYQYAGGFGYESGSADASDTSGLLTLNGAQGTAPIRLKHVGERWYQPDIGRFVMRDPIGHRGGMNLYSYAEVEPIIRVDPNGLSWIDDLFRLATLIDERQILHSLAVEQGDLSAAARYAKQLARLRNLIPRWWLPLMPVCAAYIGAEAGDAFDDYLKSLGGQPWGGPPTAGHWRQFLRGTGYD